jgi:hypothetical protein
VAHSDRMHDVDREVTLKVDLDHRQVCLVARQTSWALGRSLTIEVHAAERSRFANELLDIASTVLGVNVSFIPSDHLLPGPSEPAH